MPDSQKRPAEDAPAADDDDANNPKKPSEAAAADDDGPLKKKTKKGKNKVTWTADEDRALLASVRLHPIEAESDHGSDAELDEHDIDWDAVAAEAVPTKTPVQCLQRYLVLKQEQPQQQLELQQEQQHPQPPTQQQEQSLSSNDPPRSVEAASAAAAAAAVVVVAPSSEQENVQIEAAASGSQASGDDDDDGDDEQDGEGENNTETGTGSEGESNWTKEESALLKKLVEQYQDTAPRWTEIAANFTDHSAIDCLTQWQSLTNPPSIKGKGSWTAEEDAILKAKRALYGRKWAKIAAHLPGRLGKQCRERFVNHLDPQLKKGDWTGTSKPLCCGRGNSC
jgi:Myb-like DNA-binding domain